MRELDILRNKNINKFDNIYNVIKKYYLRFDALEYLYVSLSTSWQISRDFLPLLKL